MILSTNPLARFAQIAIALLLVCPLGCAATATQQAAILRDHTFGQTAQIDDAVDQADEDIDGADAMVLHATTQPANPPATQADLAGAHEKLGSAHNALAPVRRATASIRSDATRSAAITADVDAKLQKANASWFSRKQKILAGSLLALAVIAFGIAFLARSIGFGPIISVAMEILGDVVKFIWSAIKRFFRLIFHIGTFGSAALGAHVGDRVKAKVTRSQTDPTIPAASPTAAPHPPGAN